MKVTNVDTSIDVTLNFRRGEIMELHHMIEGLDMIIEVADANKVGKIDDLEKAGQALEFLYDILKNCEEIR